jgi:hypothetical protein
MRPLPGTTSVAFHTFPVTGSGNLDPFVAEFNLDTKTATDCFDVFSQCIDLGTIKVTVLDAGHPVLTDVQASSQLDLRQVGCLAELTKPVGPDLIEHTFLMGIHRYPVNRTLGQHLLNILHHYDSPFRILR